MLKTEIDIAFQITSSISGKPFISDGMRQRYNMYKHTSALLSDEQLLKTVGDLLVGGTETTATTLRWFLIFLVRWPNVQKRMREEIDTVCPDDSLINYSDRLQMPYVEAAILECQRFADIAPFSLAHAASRDVTLMNYVVPKGTFVIPNLSSVHQDPVLWENPDAFQPERFLDADGKLNKPDYLIPFSIGKVLFLLLSRCVCIVLANLIFSKTVKL